MTHNGLIGAFAMALLTLALAMPTVAVAVEPSAEGAIRQNSSAFLNAFNNGNADGVLVNFEDAAVVMPPGLPPFIGRAAIRQFVENGIASARTHAIKLTLGAGDEVAVVGDLAWHSGPYSVARAGMIIDDGKYLEVWHRADNRWRMIRRMWNSNRPPPTPAQAPAAPAK